MSDKPFKYTCEYCHENKEGHPWLTATYKNPPRDTYRICPDCQADIHTILREGLQTRTSKLAEDFREIVEAILRPKK